MNRKVLYNIGRIFRGLGIVMQKPFDKLEWFGRDLIEKFCDCEKCLENIERRKRLGKVFQGKNIF